MDIRKTIAAVITATMALSMTACGNSETPYVENKTQSVATAANSNGNFSNNPFGTGNNVSEAPIQEHMWEVIPEIPVTEASAFSYGYNDEFGSTGIVVTDYTGQSANVRIPGTFEGKPVVKVDLGLCNKKITELVLPDSVKKFELSSTIKKTLQYANVPAAMTEVGAGLFNKMRGDECSESCEKLTSVFIPNSVTKIDDYAFIGCESLTNITIPDGVTEIGGYAFYYCTSLANITIPGGVTEIGSCAFWNCTSLTDITILNGVTKIGDYAFWNCTSLTSIAIPSSVTEIGGAAFSGCTNLTSATHKGKTYDCEHINDLYKAINGN